MTGLSRYDFITDAKEDITVSTEIVSRDDEFIREIKDRLDFIDAVFNSCYQSDS